MKTKKSVRRYAYILVEVGKREFESRLVLKRELEGRGFTVIIGLKNLLIDLLVISALPKGIIFDKCAQLSSNWRIKYLKKKGFKYTCLDEEGIFTKLPEVIARNKNLDNVDHLFINNRKHFNLLVKSNSIGFNEGKTSITGNLRQSKRLFNEYRDSSHSESNNDVLIIGNFSQFRIGAEAREWDRDLLGRFDEEAIQIVRKLKNDEDFNIFYRPHPSETSWYKKHFSNERVLKEGNILSLLSRFKKIICFRCTTALEGRFLNLEVHNFSNSSPVAPILTRIGCVFKNYEELKINLLSHQYEPLNPKREKKVLDFLIPNKNPEIKIADAIEALSIESNRKIYGRICFLFSHILWFSYKIWYRKKVKIMYDKFSTNEIEHRLNCMDIKSLGKFIYE